MDCQLTDRLTAPHPQIIPDHPTKTALETLVCAQNLNRLQVEPPI